MSRQSIVILALSVIATAAITARRFVTGAGAQAGAGENALGVAQYDVASGEMVAVTTLGTEVVEAGAAISANALVEADASGRAITRTGGAIVGRLAPGESAGASGEFVEVILIPN